MFIIYSNNTLFKESLQERINTHNRQCADYNQGILQKLYCLRIIRTSHITQHIACFTLNQYISQHKLQRELIAGTQVDRCVEPGIPVRYAVVENQHRHGCLYQRHHNLKKNLSVARPIDFCRLGKTFRYRHKSFS